jgi:phage shock protein A
MDESKPQSQDSQDPIDAEIVEESTSVQAAAVTPSFDYTDGGVPTFDYVRDRIENKVATSIGAEELAAGSPQGKSIDEQMAERDRAGRDKLEEIRRQMRGE